jgi:aspartyl aminopeptidase
MSVLDRARALCQFIDRSPSPFHAVAECSRRLEEAGYVRLEESNDWTRAPKRAFVARSGSLLAWDASGASARDTGFRILGAHTDSPNLRIKPHANTGAAGFRQLGVEVYGGVLLNSWLDRDLGLSGRVLLRDGNASTARLLCIDRPLLRVAQLAIHLDREVNERGLVLDKQLHMAPIWALGRPASGEFEEFLAAELGCEARDVLAWDLMCHDVARASLLGLTEDFVVAPRLDNLCSCFCGLEAFLRASESKTGKCVPVLSLFDHEEVGSTSHRGAASPLLKDVLERILLAQGGAREDLHRAIARSWCVSADMAHGTHPNYREKHEPEHWITLNAGPVIKINTNQRYATDAEGEALFARCCESAQVPYQKYSHRSNLACGSTIGPITAAALGIRVVDVGNPQLSMHSCREMCGSADPEFLVRALEPFFSAAAGEN